MATRPEPIMATVVVPPAKHSKVPDHPFGLPLGSVRAIMALLILGYFWVALFWRGPAVALPLGHFFLLPLVLYSFTLARHDGKYEGFRLLPFVLRMCILGGTVAVGLYAAAQIVDYRARLTPDTTEFREHFLTFAAVLTLGFLAGHFFRLITGPNAELFVTIRAWLSVVGLVMLTVEIGLLVMLLSSKAGEAGFADFLRAYQFAEVGVVAAYFGTRL